MPPELNIKRAVFVLGKIDEILTWEKERGQERDLRFVDLGRYLCEVRAGQYWRLERMKTFHELSSSGNDSRRAEATSLTAGRSNAVNRAFPKRARKRLESEPYQQLRQAILRRDGWRCQSSGRRCGLQVHHIIARSHLGDDCEQNLITLCADCHRLVHGEHESDRLDNKKGNAGRIMRCTFCEKTKLSIP